MVEEEEEEEVELPRESNVSKLLTERVTKLVVVLVLFLLFMFQLLSEEGYRTQETTHRQGLRLLVELYDSGEEFYADYQTMHALYLSELDTAFGSTYPLVLLQTPDPSLPAYSDELKVLEWEPGLRSLRKPEFQSLRLSSRSGLEFVVSYSTRLEARVDAAGNMGRTTFVCFMLALSSIYFTKDSQLLVLDPLESLIEKINLLARDPLAASSDEVEQAGIYSFAKNETLKNYKDLDKLEINILEKAIVRIGQLLALGFGEAGGFIIQQNMSSSDDLDPLMPGVRTHAIFGFCIIDDFVETTEALETEIMMYVNKIAEIVHSCVDKYRGAPNKNIGEAFLCVWKFYDPDEIEQMDMLGKYSNKRMCKENRIVADLSVYAFLKVIAKINKYEHILEYNQMESIKKTVSDDFRVRMGFGLHQGWAIEGSIGSYFKIDASYLSPNVNMAARLEAATKQFGTEILISGDLHDILSEEFQIICREIDTVTVKGSIRPIRLFTIDVCIDDMIATSDPLINKPMKERKQIRDKTRKVFFQRLYSGQTTTWKEITSDYEYIELRRRHDKNFDMLFLRAYKSYLEGNWAVAGKGLKQLLKLRPNDGPSINLNKVVNIQNKGKAPDDWKGYRPLTSK
uniref:Guanylate cyclase domain-containing protein n=1 Tax=Strombidium rassoulzadegani TaxID=1082188 RepID=A0A7S3CRS2_9SPIT|mmetsp:Transcript_360/g.658  ORF Transcript_360/g.658 Transcript_360/m.658 type:complete len:626 (+) Transcript_360:182-2059(+)